MLRSNSRLRQSLEPASISFLEHTAGAINRLLPHVQVFAWRESGWKEPEAVWPSAERTELRLTLTITWGKYGRSLTTRVKRRRVAAIGGSATEIIDTREHDICREIVFRISSVLSMESYDAESLLSIQHDFDEYIVASHIKSHHKLELSVARLLDSLHTLSEQSYENKALTFGCVLDSSESKKPQRAQFPSEFLEVKKYKALSDGFRTAYHVSTHGAVVDFIDLEHFDNRPLTEKHHYPDWAEPIAKASRDNRCGVALSRQGDILIFEEGSLRFTYRFGKWQYWNHSHLINLLKDRARAQRIPSGLIGRVIGSIYRAALDISFRRSGGLFVILHNRDNLYEIVRRGDAVGDSDQSDTNLDFDEALEGHTIHSLPRSVMVELASLDGAVVLDNSGNILAYGAVLRPKKSGRLRGTEGSRTKAAIGASNYGLAIKISSDGDISVYYKGTEFIRV